MSFVLVISPNSDCRRLYVDNLVRRGYVAVGVAGVNQVDKLLQRARPELILICCMPTGYEHEVETIRAEHNLAGNLVLLTQEKPNPIWAKKWNVGVSLADPVDVRRLTDVLHPWLASLDSGLETDGRKDRAEHQ